MPPVTPTTWTAADYERAAREYLESLPLEHFMESTPQGTQGRVTLAAFEQVHGQRADFQFFNELLIQYFHERRLRQVVPDNFAALSETTCRANGSFDLELEPTRPFRALEYVSKNNKRKDYKDSFRKYERELKVPYYLVFDPDEQDLRLYRHTGKRYVLTEPNAAGRLSIPEVEMEVGLLDGWVRFWYRGELLPLTDELRQQVEELRAQEEKARREAAKQTQRAERERKRAEKEKEPAQKEQERADAEKQRAEEAEQRASAAEAELARLRREIEQARQQPGKPTSRRTRRPQDE